MATTELFERISSLPLPPEIPRQQAERARLYRCLFAAMLTARSGLDRLEARLAERHIAPRDPRQADAMERYGQFGAQYFTLCSPVRLERLTAQETAALSAALEQPEDEAALARAATVVEQSYRRVLALAPDTPELKIELYPTLDGSGSFAGNALVLGLSSSATFTAEGALADPDGEDARLYTLAGIKPQLEPILSRALNMPVCIALKV